MKKLEEEIDRLNEYKKMLGSINKLIGGRSTFEKLNEYEQSQLLVKQISELAEQISISISDKEAILTKTERRIRLYKRLLLIISFPVLITIIICQYLQYYDLSIVFAFVAILLLVFLPFFNNAIINFKGVLIFLALCLLLLFAFFLFPSGIQVLESIAGILTFLGLIFAIVLTIFSKG